MLSARQLGSSLNPNIGVCMFCKLPQNLTLKRQRIATHQGLAGERCLGGGLPPVEGSARESTDGDGRRVLAGALNRALNVQRAAVGSHICRLRYQHPSASPSGLIRVFDLVGSQRTVTFARFTRRFVVSCGIRWRLRGVFCNCLLYTSDAADEEDSVD